MPQKQARILIGVASAAVVLLVVIAIALRGGDDQDPAVLSMSESTTETTATTAMPATTEPVPTTESPPATEPAATTAPPTAIPATTSPAPTAPPPTTAAPPATGPAPTTTPPPTAAPPPTTAPPPPPPTDPPGPCAGAEQARPLPADATDQTWTTSDFDMDGVEETVRVYYDPSTNHWFARAEYPGGWASEVVLDDTFDGQVAGWATFATERLVIIEARRDADLVSTYMFADYRNCRIGQVKGPDGWNFEVTAGRVWDGSTLRTADAVRCDAGGITLTKVRPGDPGGTGWPHQYQVASTSYTWDGQTFVEGMEVSAALCCDLPAQEDVVMGVVGVDC